MTSKNLGCRLDHTKVLLMCQICGYMTSTESQLTRHERQHKEFKWYQCHLCDYKTKHNMSLFYHLKSHKPKSVKCTKCPFRSSGKTDIFAHMMFCPMNKKKKILWCNICPYGALWASDLRRHIKVHKNRSDDDDDEDYDP
jgi:hypothetical protein